MAEEIVPERTLDLSDDGGSTPHGLAPHATIGHFRITRELGAGGMGVVFEAYDPDLDRQVAIKVVRDRQAGSDAGRRLIGEAQAMARLAHPNVVAVHEVGTIENQVFVVMELVPGCTLAGWLEATRTWREIVRVFGDAGDGLVAAHDAGLVHGDFKPSNVLIDGSGRVRVADFGLARAADRDRRRLAAGSRPNGTPGYMAPEQLAGEASDARADQYAFAVALRDAVRDLPAPRRVRRAIDRALSTDPGARFPSLRELLSELRSATRIRRRAVLAAIGIAGGSAAIAASIAWSASPRRDDCLDGVSLVDTVWTPAARDARAGALAGSGSNAPVSLKPAGQTTARVLDDWASAWKLGRRSACAAEPTERPARLACLDGRLAELRAQLAVFDRGDRDVAVLAVSAAAALPSPASCAAYAPVFHAASQPVLDRCAAIDALGRAGRTVEARPQLAALLADATATGDAATLARALLTAGDIERKVGAFDAAHDHFAQSAQAAARAGDDAELLDAMIMQAAISTDRGHPLEAIGVLDGAAAIVARARVDRSERLALVRGDALTQAGRIPEGLAAFRSVVEMLEPISHTDPAARVRFAAALGALAGAETQSDHYDDARALLIRVLAIEEADYGPAHPEVAKTLHDLANNETHLQQFAEARAHYERARAIFVATYGANNQLVALSDEGIGAVELDRGHAADARPFFERALAVLLVSVGPDHPDVGVVEEGLGAIDRDDDRCREAIPHFERALAIANRAGRTGTALAIDLTNLGACLAEVSRDAEARSMVERALAELARSGVPEAERAEANVILAEIEWRAGHHARAIAIARDAVAATSDRGVYATLHDYIEHELAGWTHQ